MAQNHAQACTQITQALTAAMNAASAYCERGDLNLENTRLATQVFAPATNNVLFSSGILCLLNPSSDTKAQGAWLDLQTCGHNPSAIDIRVRYIDSDGKYLPRVTEDRIPLNNDFMTPLADVTTSQIISNFFHAVFGPEGQEVAMRTMISCVELEP